MLQRVSEPERQRKKAARLSDLAAKDSLLYTLCPNVETPPKLLREEAPQPLRIVTNHVLRKDADCPDLSYFCPYVALGPCLRR